jgi:excisionase family DNA binding protein
VQYSKRYLQHIALIPSIRYNIAMYSVKEASEQLGIDPSQIRRLIKAGKIKAKKVARDWVVLELDYKRRRKPGAGRKRTKGGIDNE